MLKEANLNMKVNKFQVAELAKGRITVAKKKYLEAKSSRMAGKCCRTVA